MPKTAYLALGANLGDAKNQLQEAIKALNLVPGLKITRVSSFYITKPWGYTQQADFTNACCEAQTDLTPEALLGVCLGVEAGMGRVRSIKNGPRCIDIDLLLYENETRNTKELILPHPRMWERDFVMKPLSELAKNGKILGYELPNEYK